MIELRHLKTLVALRSTGSLVDAADRLHLTQSALSHQLKALEHLLDAELFIRKSKPLQFTPAGQRLLKLADDLLPRVEAAQRDLQRLSSGQAGRLHLAIECHSCYQWLMPTLDAFRQKWPEVEVDVPGGHHFAPLGALKRQELDLVITADPRPIEGICYTPLFRYESLLAIPKDHAFAAKDWIEPADLAGETLITYPVERNLLDVFGHFLDPAGVEPAAIRTAELTILMMQLVASHRGVCALPNWALTEYLERQYVIARRMGQEGTWGTLYAAHREQQQGLAFISDFIDTARQISAQVLSGIRPVD
ncbi:LysR family transcriptional regulator [Marinospirillum alkaliphilum]|uniref:HTH-type transcriptional regulator MetR n=1 Tax=Marinospirillum alkaliphilum DSM 21637 TaxID=1122209 RepID=A0A1K1V0E7_9GAMM|nr:LysR family transcriptional regulator [Marinospirillum alkaliphilum]SFX18574.1 transcriptional regulator, LysR family [Marinospirillum alkaliphilum DSM 21637]